MSDSSDSLPDLRASDADRERVVEVLRRAGSDGRLTVEELEDIGHQQRSVLTRRVARLEQAGLVKRRSANGDGRGIVAAMTLSGREAFAAMERSQHMSISTDCDSSSI